MRAPTCPGLCRPRFSSATWHASAMASSSCLGQSVFVLPSYLSATYMGPSSASKELATIYKKLHFCSYYSLHSSAKCRKAFTVVPSLVTRKAEAEAFLSPLASRATVSPDYSKEQRDYDYSFIQVPFNTKFSLYPLLSLSPSLIIVKYTRQIL